MTLLDSSQRPLFLPVANGLFNVGGVLEKVDSQQVVGSVQGLPVVTDPNIPTTLSSTQDAIFVMRAEALQVNGEGRHVGS
jgi:hypothetical protein